MSDNDDQRARDIVHAIRYVTIASVSAKDEPWNTPVFAAVDGSFNFYWASDAGAQHSRNIAGRPQVFLAVYDSTVPEGTGEGVYVQAVAGMLREPDAIRHALALLGARAGTPPGEPSHFQGDHPRRVYRASVQRAWINSEGSRGGEYVDIRVPITLTEDSIIH